MYVLRTLLISYTLFTFICICFVSHSRVDSDSNFEPGSSTMQVDIPSNYSLLDGGNSNMFYFHPYLVKIPILTNVLKMGGSSINQMNYSWFTYLFSCQYFHCWIIWGPVCSKNWMVSDSKEVKMQGQGAFGFPDPMMYGFLWLQQSPGVQRRRPKLLRCNDVPNFCGTVIHPKMDPLQLDMWASNRKKNMVNWQKIEYPRLWRM